MTVLLKKVWGRGARRETRTEITWIFTTIASDGTGQRYRLHFDATTRKFLARRITRRDDPEKLAAYLDALPGISEQPEIKSRNVTAVLRSRLSPDEIVATQRKAILYGRSGA